MRLVVCGVGTVGRATGEGFARLGHDVYTYDINPFIFPWATQLRSAASPAGTEVVFFCTPEEAIPGAVRNWSGPGIRVVRSSTPPGTTARLAKELGIHIFHNPEGLREATALQDFLNPSYVLIGTAPYPLPSPSSAMDLLFLEALYHPFGVPVIKTSSTVSEMVKLATNGLLATLIAYWNDLGQLCQALGVSSHEVGMVASRDPRVPGYGARNHGQRYGGRCLPKDIQQLLTLAQRHLGPDVTSEVPVLAGVSKWSE